jgi:tetratricopeptide (TPR) repeat protein
MAITISTVSARPPFPAAVVLLAGLAAAAGCGGCGPSSPAPGPAALPAAEKALVEGHYGAALRGLRSILPDDLPGPEARLRAARAAAKVMDFDLVARFLEADAKGDLRGAAEACLLRAEGLVRSGKFEAAKEALAALETAGVRTDRWRYDYSILCLARGDREVARHELEDLVSGGTRDADILVRWAELALDQPAVARRRLGEGIERADDRAVVQTALGRFLLVTGGDPRAAAAELEDAVRARPWDREARLDIVRARLRAGGEASVHLAVEEAERLLGEDPDDAEARLACAETLGESGRLAAGDTSGGVNRPATAIFEKAAAQYQELLRRGTRDEAAAIRALQGFARTQVELVANEPGPDARVPGSHFARAMEALDRAEALDREGKLTGPFGVRLLAETWYLRGRANRKAHDANSDHTDALFCFEKAFETDHHHLEASWDLGLLCYDLLRTPEYVQKTAMAFGCHDLERKRRGLPPLDGPRLLIFADAMKRAREGRGIKPGEVPGEPGPKDGKPAEGPPK